MPISRRELLCFASGIIVYGTLTQIYRASWSMSSSSATDSSLEDFTLSLGGVSTTSRQRQSLAEVGMRVKAALDEEEPEEIEADDEVVQQRQQMLKRRNKRKRSPRGALKLPTPIFLLSLPKSGTTSTHKFFTCGSGDGRFSANHWIENATGYKARIGQCMHDNVQEGRNVIAGCGDYKVFTDIGAVWTEGNMRSSSGITTNCYYPSIHGLDAIYKDHPQATIMIVYRNSTEWAKSIFTWNNLAGRLGSCPGFPSTPYLASEQTYDNLNEWIQFYDRHTETIRQFAEDHPSLTFVEAALEPDETADILHQRTGIDADCWKKCKPESGCVETDQNGNEVAPKRNRQAVRSKLEFASFTPGGRLFQGLKPVMPIADLLKVSTPIFVLSLPKSKLIKTYQYFRCGFRKTNNDLNKVRFRSVMVKGDKVGESIEIEIGQKMWKNQQAGLLLMDGIDNESVLMDMGSFWEQDGKTVCNFPSLHDLEGLLNSSPSPTFILFTRDSVEWTNELHSSNNLMGRLSMICKDYGFPETPFLPSDRTEDDLQKWIDFYEAHTDAIRTFAAEHPSLTYIEIDIDDEQPEELLEQEIGIPAPCW